MINCPNCHIPNPYLYNVDHINWYCKNCNEDMFPIFKLAIDEAVEEFRKKRSNKK